MWRALPAVLLAACSPGPAWVPPPTAQDVALLYAPHGAPEGPFFNPWAQRPHTVLDGLRWWLSPNPYDKSAELRIRVVANDGGSLLRHAASAEVTWVGHATFAIHDEGDVVLTDPHFGDRALIPKRKVPPGVPIEAIPPDAFAVISHNHYDHLDAWTVDHLPDSMTWYVPLGMAQWFRDRGRERVVELDWWQSAHHGRWSITCLPSQHWSRRAGQWTNEALWCSWLLDSGKRRYYFAGDSGYFHGFAEFGRRFGPIDVAMLPIGAYEPRWLMAYQHLGPEHAWRAFRDLGARWFLPMHWGTFDLTDEPLDLPPRELVRVIRESGGDLKPVRILAIGERWHFPD